MQINANAQPRAMSNKYDFVGDLATGDGASASS